MTTLRNSLVLLGAVTLSAASANAQTYYGDGTTAAPITNGATLRGRGLAGTTGAEVYVAASPSDLGTANRDGYQGVWNAGATPVRTYSFTMSWNAATSLLTWGVSPYTQSLSSGVPVRENAAQASNGVPSTYNTSTNLFEYTAPGTFNMFRLYSRSATSVTALTYDGVDILPSSPLAINNETRYWSADASQSFSIAGTMDVTMNGSNEATRFEVGVAQGAIAAVPEPSTYALMGTGLAALVGIARRRKHSA